MHGRNLAWACLAASLGCHGAPGSVQSLTVQIAVTPATLEFGPVYLQATATQMVSVQNSGTAAESATVALTSSSFTAVGGPSFELPPGSTTTIPIAFNPTSAAVDQATAHLVWDEGSADLALSGIGHAWPDCSPGAPCEAATFDPQAGVCKTSQLPDGSSCDGGTSSCLQDSRCQAGQCVGVPLDCDDDNACTTDSCVEGQGCVHQDTTECTGTDPCQVYSCDPKKGCTSTNAPNGTLCSNDESCQTADICVFGKCVGTPVPDGFPCALWWAPCVTDAECHKGTCDSPTADAEKPGDVRWSWQPDAGDLPYAIDVPAVDELGNSYVCGSSQNGGWASGEMDLASLDQCGLRRWENGDFRGVTTLLLAGQELVFVDPSTHDLVALYRDTGQPLWKVNLIPSLLGTAPDGGDPGCNQVQTTQLALSPTGPIYAAGTITDECTELGVLPQPFLAAILPNGSVAWTNHLAAFSQPVGQELMVDGQGNAYLYVAVSTEDLAGPYLASYDPQGQTRFLVPLASQAPVLALGTDRVVEASAGQVWDLDGGSRGTLDAGIYGAAQSSSVVIDGQNDVYVFGTHGGYYGASLAAFAADQSPPFWSLDLNLAVSVSNLVLGQGQLFYAMGESCGGCPIGTTPPNGQAQTLTAVESATGQQLWTTPVAIGVYPYPAATMTLANTGTLILASGGQVTAFFAGQQTPPQNAPWSRVGGSYWNQSSSAPPAPPSLPAGSPTP